MQGINNLQKFLQRTQVQKGKLSFKGRLIPPYVIYKEKAVSSDGTETTIYKWQYDGNTTNNVKVTTDANGAINAQIPIIDPTIPNGAEPEPNLSLQINPNGTVLINKHLQLNIKVPPGNKTMLESYIGNLIFKQEEFKSPERPELRSTASY